MGAAPPPVQCRLLQPEAARVRERAAGSACRRDRLSTVNAPLSHRADGSARTHGMALQHVASRVRRQSLKKPSTVSARVVVLGSAGVGKTSIIDQFLFSRFTEEYTATIEQLYHESLDIEGTIVSLDILDTSGAHSFPAMKKLAITSGDAFILVFAVDDIESFDNVTRLRDEIIELKKTNTVPMVIVGNKLDVGERRVLSKEMIDSLVNIEWENRYTEVSAKENSNISGIFEQLFALVKVVTDKKKDVNRRRISLPVSLFRSKRETCDSGESRNSCGIS